LADVVFNSFKAKIMSEIDLDTDTIKCALMTTAYTPNQDTHIFWDDVSANEASGTNYTAGGSTMAGTNITTDTSNNEGVYDASDVTWTSATVSAQYAVLYKSTGTASTSPLVCCFDFGSEKTSSGGNFVIQWHDDGIINLG